MKSLFPAAIIFLTVAGSSAAGDISALLSSDSGHYREALEGFQETVNQPVKVANIQKERPASDDKPKVIVAFGGKAVQDDFVSKAPLIVCLAPGLEATPVNFQKAQIYVEMIPPSALYISSLKKIQPSVSRMAMLWSSDSMRRNGQSLQAAAKSVGIELMLIHVNDSAELPKRLRELEGKVDALLLPPDPALVNLQNFTTIKDFCWDNHLPFYVPTESLVELGGTASISSSFREIGRTAGKAAQDILNGKRVYGTIYPEKADVSINLNVAKNANLHIPPDVLEKADKVFQ